MNLSFLKRTIQVPETNQTRPIEVPCLWFVRWKSGNDVYVGTPKLEAEAFTSEEEAKTFKESLISALKLLRYRAKGGMHRSDDCPYNITIEAQTKSDS